MAKIKDFGEKIGGARKDFYARALNISDLDQMNQGERARYVNKKSIWPTYNAVKLVQAGEDPGLLFWKNEMRKSVICKPSQFQEQYLQDYITIMSAIRDKVNSICSLDKISEFWYWLLINYLDECPGYSRYVSVKPEAKGVIDNKLIRAAQRQASYYQIKAKEKMYGMTKEEKQKDAIRNQYLVCQIGKDLSAEYDKDHNLVVKRSIPGGTAYSYVRPGECFHDLSEYKEGNYVILNRSIRKPVMIDFKSEKEALDFIDFIIKYNWQKMTKDLKSQKKRKRKFPIPELSNIERTGPNYVKSFCGTHATGQNFLDLGLRAGEFGNWLSDADAICSMDRCYEAFHDLSRLLKISPKSVSLNGELAIAFGSRGHGNAVAHYESLRKVINLTKYKGMGSLGHEWGHALDDCIGYVSGIEMSANGTFASEHFKNPMIPRSFVNVMEIILKNGRSDYYLGSKKFDSLFTKSGHGYWSSACELFARAFDCYLADKLKEERNRSDYLTNHSDDYKYQIDNETIYAYPRGSERKEINQAMDDLINDLIQCHFLDERVEDKIMPEAINRIASNEFLINPVYGEDGQFCFTFV